MALTLSDYAMQSSDTFEKGVVKRFVATSDLAKQLTWKKISGDTFKYRVEEQLPGVSWRRVNEAYPESTGLISPREEKIFLVGGDMFADRFIRRTQRSGGDAVDIIAEQADMKARSLMRELERVFFEGSPLQDPDEPMGMRDRLTGNQVILAGAGGATLTLAMVDALLDAVAHDVGRVGLWMGKSTRRFLTNLVKAQGNAVQITYSNVSDAAGQQIQTYDGFPVFVVEDQWDTSTILDAEDPGDGTADTYSIYALALGDEMGIHGIYNGDGPMVDCYQVTKETETGPPGEKWRIEFYPGYAMRHPRSGARLRGALIA